MVISIELLVKQLALKVIEVMWDHLDTKQDKKQPPFKEDLWNVLQEFWTYFHVSLQMFQRENAEVFHR